MFQNAGKKIKIIALALFWIIVIADAITIIALLDLGAKATVLVLIPVGVLAAWLSSITLYAFGEMCENVMSLENDVSMIRIILEQRRSTPKKSQDATSSMSGFAVAFGSGTAETSDNAAPTASDSTAEPSDPDSQPADPVE